MKAERNRFERQDHPGFPRAGRARRRRRLGRWGAQLLAAAALALAAAPAQAGTGGASTLAAAEANAGRGIVFAPMRWAGATWYGPGLYGRHTACGQRLQPRTIGVAHRSLPCGTAVKFAYHGRVLVARVIDRGPYTRGNSWDLTYAAARALSFDRVGADRVRFAVPLDHARKGRTRRPAGP